MSGVGNDITALNTGAFSPPTLSRIIRDADIGTESFQLVAEDVSSATILDDTLGSPSLAALGIDPSQLSGITGNDWVAFNFTAGRVGRRHDPLLTGPKSTARQNSLGIGYMMSDIPGGMSPPTLVSLPAFTLPIPAHSGLTVNVSGAVESVNSSASSQTVEVDLKSANPFFDTKLVALSVGVTHPSGVWDNVLLPYAASYTLATDSNGFVYGPQGSSGKTNPQIYQLLDERYGVSNGQSSTVTIP